MKKANYTKANVNKSLPLPDIYSGKLNTKRIKAYKKLEGEYNIDKSCMRDIFCKGADWYKELQANSNDR